MTRFFWLSQGQRGTGCIDADHRNLFVKRHAGDENGAVKLGMQAFRQSRDGRRIGERCWLFIQKQLSFGDVGRQDSCPMRQLLHGRHISSIKSLVKFAVICHDGIDQHERGMKFRQPTIPLAGRLLTKITKVNAIRLQLQLLPVLENPWHFGAKIKISIGA